MSKKLIVTYDPMTGTLVPDALVDDWAEETLKQFAAMPSGGATPGGNPTWCEVFVGSADMIDAIRILIRDDRISHKAVEFRYRHFVITSNDVGQLDQWPDGFCNYNLKRLKHLMTGRK